MSAERRLAAVEAALSPTELVVAWLTEGHAHGSIDAFARANLADDAYVPPINRLAHAATEEHRLRLKGHPREEIGKASDQAVRETLFRFHLAMRINVVCHELLDREQLLMSLFSMKLVLHTHLPEVDGPWEDPLGIASLRDLIGRSTQGLRAVGAAREEVERRYLAGQSALFPDDATRYTSELGVDGRRGRGAGRRTCSADQLPASCWAAVRHRVPCAWTFDRRLRRSTPRSDGRGSETDTSSAACADRDPSRSPGGAAPPDPVSHGLYNRDCRRQEGRQP